MKVEKLTKVQESLFPAYIKKWTDIGLSTEKANRTEAEKGVLLAYKIAGLNPPKIVWCDSPLSMGITRAVVLGLKNGEVKVGDSVWASVWASVWDSVRASVWDSVRDSVRASVWDSVWDSVGASVGDSCYGQHDASWLGFYDFFKDACGLEEETQKLVGLWLVSKNAGWWLPHEKICWISERHNILNRDNRGRLHCENGIALQYPDGWGIYAWHGTRVSEKVIMRSSELTKEEILNEKNSEISRVIAEKLGWEKYMEVLGTVLVDKMFDPDKKLHYELYDFKDRKFELMPRLLKMESPELNDGTRPYYIEPVDPGLKSCAAARRWQFMKPDLSWPNVEECNRSSELVFDWES